MWPIHLDESVIIGTHNDAEEDNEILNFSSSLISYFILIILEIDNQCDVDSQNVWLFRHYLFSWYSFLCNASYHLENSKLIKFYL